jgi:hypothetical protein
LRTVGNYKSARHKFEKALKYDPENETARFEMAIVEKIIKLDEEIPLEDVPSMKRPPGKLNGQPDGSIAAACVRNCTNSSCSIF